MWANRASIMKTHRNPSRATFEGLMARHEWGLRGIICKVTGDIFVADAYAMLHFKLAAATGVELYTSFCIAEHLEGEARYALDYPALYDKLPFLHSFKVYVATVGVIGPKDSL